MTFSIDQSAADGATVVMLHSGGMPATFAYHADIAAHLRIVDSP